MEDTLFVIHISSLVLLCILGTYRSYLLFRWFLIRNKSTNDVAQKGAFSLDPVPFVTVQLPLYNERFVVRRLLKAVSRLKWPLDRLEIQVLDDSNDDTSTLLDEVCQNLKQRGVNVQIIRRNSRSGYKAGALALGLLRARGEFLAIFDADFVPGSDFLLRTIPHFKDPGVGMVQARWGFLNEGYSLLTRLQSIFLRYHFMVEQRVRNAHGWFFNFNGTAGVWRKEAIEQAGGWQADTVTEDLDLSLRAALLGWKSLYLDDVEVMSELPVTLSALRGQQARWAKGSMQTLRKMFYPLWSSSWSLSQKFHATMLLVSNAGWFLGMSAFLTLRYALGSAHFQNVNYLMLLFLGCGSIFLSYGLLEYLTKGNREKTTSLLSILMIPLAGIVLAPKIVIAIAHGLFRKGGEFNRTPKFGAMGKGLKDLPLFYHSWEFFPIFTDLLLLLYSAFTVYDGHVMGHAPTVFFFSLFTAGLLTVLFFDAREILLAKGFRG